MKGKIILVTGGVKSGKTAYVVRRTAGYRKKAYLATAEVIDQEIAYKVRAHKEERDETYLTIEEPLDVPGVIENPPADVDVIIVDCITMWVNNLVHYDKDVPTECARLREALWNSKIDVVLVTNEVGLGVVGLDPLTRKYVNELGITNQAIAAVAEEVRMVVAGIPIMIKETKEY